jgi:predicted HAD superfamily phosphohydrolase YqeG
MGSMDHILAGFTLGFRHRRTMAGLLLATPDNCSILTLQPEQLRQSGIRALAIDFDGVLSPHGFQLPLPEATLWLKQCAAVFGEERLFILSNKPTQERSDWFAKNFSRMRFVSGVRKKPYPDGLQLIEKLAAVPPHSILMVDDRLLTGCLAAVNAGARPCYIRSPYISLSHRPFAEIFFMTLRSIERTYIRLCSRF